MRNAQTVGDEIADPIVAAMSCVGHLIQKGCKELTAFEGKPVVDLSPEETTEMAKLQNQSKGIQAKGNSLLARMVKSLAKGRDASGEEPEVV